MIFEDTIDEIIQISRGGLYLSKMSEIIAQFILTVTDMTILLKSNNDTISKQEINALRTLYFEKSGCFYTISTDNNK